MCDELGPTTDYMMEYVEEMGNTSLCGDGNENSDGCQTYVNSIKQKSIDAWKAEFEKVNKLINSPKTINSLKDWLTEKRDIMEKLVPSDDVKDEL